MLTVLFIVNMLNSQTHISIIHLNEVLAVVLPPGVDGRCVVLSAMIPDLNTISLAIGCIGATRWVVQLRERSA